MGMARPILRSIERLAAPVRRVGGSGKVRTGRARSGLWEAHSSEPCPAITRATEKPIAQSSIPSSLPQVSRSSPAKADRLIRSSSALRMTFPSPGTTMAMVEPDLAVYRPSNGLWSILRTTAGSYRQPYGTSGDIPTPAAFVP